MKMLKRNEVRQVVWADDHACVYQLMSKFIAGLEAHRDMVPLEYVDDLKIEVHSMGGSSHAVSGTVYYMRHETDAELHQRDRAVK